MGMTRAFIPCDDCYDFLFKTHHTAAIRWLYLCNYAQTHDHFVPFSLPEDIQYRLFNDDIDLLEKKGFVVTHEAESGRIWIIKLLGLDQSYERVCIHAHDPPPKRRL